MRVRHHLGLLRVVAVSSIALSQTAGFATAGIVPIAELYRACEDAIYGEPGSLMERFGPSLRQGAFLATVETEHGWVVLDYEPPAYDGFEFCGVWGITVPETEDMNLSLATWPSVSRASEAWFEAAMRVPGSIALNGPGFEGHSIARCDDLEHGVALISQEVELRFFGEEPETHYKFLVQTIPPGRCEQAIARYAQEGSE